MDPRYSSYDQYMRQQQQQQQQAQNATSPRHGNESVAYTFDGLVSVQQQQRQAYLNSLQAPQLAHHVQPVPVQQQQQQQQYFPQHVYQTPQMQQYPQVQQQHPQYYSPSYFSPANQYTHYAQYPQQHTPNHSNNAINFGPSQSPAEALDRRQPTAAGQQAPQPYSSAVSSSTHKSSPATNTNVAQQHAPVYQNQTSPQTFPRPNQSSDPHTPQQIHSSPPSNEHPSSKLSSTHNPAARQESTPVRRDQQSSQVEVRRFSHIRLERPRPLDTPQAKPAAASPLALDGSNDYAIKSVYSPAAQKQQTHPNQQSKIPPQIKAQTKTKPAIPPEPVIDQRILLLSLAHEYITQARASIYTLTVRRNESDQRHYHKLIASGLACYETVLQNQSWQLTPRQEAMVRFRFATVLFEETENDTVIEETLAKGLALCERNRLFDIKYSMQHLLTRAIFASKPKAAIKQLEKLFEEVRVGRNVPWIYALQFLRVDLLSQQSALEVRHAVSVLQVLAELARSQRDTAICALASIREAMLHMRLRGNDWREEADRALASARAQCMGLGDQAAPQLGALLHLLDLALTLAQCRPKMAEEKRKAMVEFLDSTAHSASIQHDGTFLLPVRSITSASLEIDTCGIFAKDSRKKTCLRLKWLDKTDLFALAYTLNATVRFLKSHAQERPQADSLLKEALKYTDTDHVARDVAMPLTAASEHIKARKLLRCHILINLVIVQCNRSDVSEASSTMSLLKSLVNTPGMDAGDNINTLFIYLEAMLLHANAQLDEALSAYQSPQLALDTDAPVSSIQQQLGILAALCVILIIREPRHPSHGLLKPLLSKMAPLFADINDSSDAYERGMSPQLAAAYSLVLATAHEDRWSDGDNTSVLSTKKHLKVCFAVGKDMANHLLLAASMSFLHAQMFHGQVGEQALKSTQNAQDFARNSGSVLWTCASDGLAAAALERHGQAEASQQALAHGEQAAARLPSGVLAMLNGG